MKGPVAATEDNNDDEDNDEKWATFQTAAATATIQRLGEGKNQKNKLNHNHIVHETDSPGLVLLVHEKTFYKTVDSKRFMDVQKGLSSRAQLMVLNINFFYPHFQTVTRV